MSVQGQPGPVEREPHRGDEAEARAGSGRRPAVAVASTRRPGRPQRGVRSGVDHGHRGRPVVDAAGVAGGHRAARGGTPAAAGPSRSTVSPARGRSSRVTLPTGTISASNPPRRRGPLRRERATGRRRRPAALAVDAGLLGEQVGGQAHVRVAGRRRGERRPLVAHRARRRRGGRPEPPRRGARPTRRRRRARPRARRAASPRATSIAARPLPHCRSTVSAGTSTGRPAASAATRATSPPGPMQLPSTTSRTALGQAAVARQRGEHRRGQLCRRHVAPGAAGGADRRCAGRPRSPGTSWRGRRIMAAGHGSDAAQPAAGRPAVAGGRQASSPASAARSTLPAPVRGNVGDVEPPPGPVRAVERGAARSRAGRGGRSPSVSTTVSDSPRSLLRDPEDDDLSGGHRSQHRLHVGQVHGHAGRGDGPLAPGEHQPVRLDTAAVTDGGEPFAVPPERAGRAVVPAGTGRRIAPTRRRPGRPPRPRGTGAGPPRARPRPRTSSSAAP